jgi:hypothetical protein
MRRKWAHDLAVFAFDLLHLNGEDFRPMPPTGPATVETADHAILFTWKPSMPARHSSGWPKRTEAW